MYKYKVGQIVNFETATLKINICETCGHEEDSGKWKISQGAIISRRLTKPVNVIVLQDISDIPQEKDGMMQPYQSTVENGLFEETNFYRIIDNESKRIYNIGEYAIIK